MDKFKEKFELPRDGFSQPIEFIDGNIGFSTTKQYSNGYASLFRIFIPKERTGTIQDLQPIWANVSYGKETSDGITVASSTEKIKGIFDPIDLHSEGEFFYNIAQKKFYAKNKEIPAFEILRTLDRQHIKPTLPIEGFWLRTKLVFWRIMVPYLLEYLSHFFVLVLWIVSGKKTSWNIWQRVILSDRSELKNTPRSQSRSTELPKIDQSHEINLFGYEGNPWPIIFYCTAHLVMYIIFCYENIRPRLILEIFTNNFLTVIYVIPTLAATVNLLPKIIEFCILKTASLFQAVSYKKIKV
jgi:hypothetical protein